MQKFHGSPDVNTQYPEFEFFGIKVSNVVVSKKLQFVKARKKQILKDFQQTCTPENVRENIKVKAIRDLFEQMGVDPDREKTAVENLAALIAKSGGIPSINSVVDSCNLASLATQMPVGVFDADQIKGDIILRLSNDGETYEPIGKEKEILSQGILVLADEECIISRPLYKDSQRTMITEETKNIYIFTAKYPPITENDVKEALDIAAEIVCTSSQGEVEK